MLQVQLLVPYRKSTLSRFRQQEGSRLVTYWDLIQPFRRSLIGSCPSATSRYISTVPLLGPTGLLGSLQPSTQCPCRRRNPPTLFNLPDRKCCGHGRGCMRRSHGTALLAFYWTASRSSLTALYRSLIVFPEKDDAGVEVDPCSHCAWPFIYNNRGLGSVVSKCLHTVQVHRCACSRTLAQIPCMSFVYRGLRSMYIYTLAEEQVPCS